MSVNRDQNVASNTSSLLDIPLKKRKGSKFGAFFPPSDGCTTKQIKKRKNTSVLTCNEEDILYPRPINRKNCEYTSAWVDGDNNDSVDTMYINPYLNHVGNNVTSQESETSHSLDSLVQKGSGHLSVSDLNTADHNLKAQTSFSPHKYFPMPNELCGIVSDIDKLPCVLDLTKNSSVHECSEKSRNRASNMQFISDTMDHSLVSTLTQKRDYTLPVSVLKDKTAYANDSSASCNYFQMFPESSDDFTRNKMVYESSETSRERTSGTQIEFESKPSVCEDWRLLQHTSGSQKGCSSSSSLVGIYENICLPAPVFEINPVVPQFRNGFTQGLELCENECHSSSKFDIEPNHSHALPLSLRPYGRKDLGSEFPIQTSLYKSAHLSESEPYSVYEFNIHSKLAQPKSGLTSSVKFTEHDTSPIIQSNAHARTESLSYSVSQQSNSTEFPKHDKQDDSSNFFDIKMNCIKSCSTKKDQEIIVPKSKLHQIKHDFVHLTGSTPHFEIGTDGEAGTVTKQKSYCSYGKSQDNHKKQFGEKISVTERQCQGEERNTKGSSIEEEVPCYKCGILPASWREIEKNVMNHHWVVNQDINKDRKHSKEEVTVCIDDTRMLNVEENHCEGSVLTVSTDDGVSVHYISDGSEDTDDVEIIRCISKSKVGMRNVSVQQKELNSIINPTWNSDLEAADQNIVSHPYDLSKVNISKSSMKANGYAIPNSAGNVINERKGDTQRPSRKSVREPHYRTSRAHNDIVTNVSLSQPSTSMMPLCLKMHRETPTPTSQALPSGDLSHNTVIQSVGTPACLSSVKDSLPRKKLFSPFHSSNSPCEKSRNVPSKKYPSSSNVLSVPSSGSSSYTQPYKKRSCGRNLVPVDRHEHFWNSTIPGASTNNCVTSSPESAISVCRNSQEESSEPDNQEILMPLKVIPQLTSAHGTTLETTGLSHNLQEDREIFQKEGILIDVSDSLGEKQTGIAEYKAETKQKGHKHEWECAICLEAINSKGAISATVCGHVYCTPCITEVVYKRKECPTCRKALESDQVHPLYIFG